MPELIGYVPTTPKTIHRANGGWLAVATQESQFRFGVTGNTEQEAIEAFGVSERRWTEILEFGSAPHQFVATRQGA